MITTQIRERLGFYQRLMRSRSKYRPPKQIIERMALDFLLSTPIAENANDLHVLGFRWDVPCPAAVRRRAQVEYYKVYHRLSHEKLLLHREYLYGRTNGN